MSTPPSAYPIQVTAEVPATSSRLLGFTGIIFVKMLLLLPHLIVLSFIGIAAFFVGWIGYFAILFTGRLPEGFHRFITGYLRWNTRLSGWLFSLTDTYPPFSLDGSGPGTAR